MTSSHYDNVIQWTIKNIGIDHIEDSAYVAKEIFDNCGVAFPIGNCETIRMVLENGDYTGWRVCTAEEAQRFANEGTAAVCVGTEQLMVIRPEKEYILVKSTFAGSKSADRCSGIVSECTEESDMQYFAYSAAATTSHPDVYATVCQKNSTLTSAQMNRNARYIFQYLTYFGFTKQAACGVLGNMQQESAINPGIWENLNNCKGSYGLCQWREAQDILDWTAECKYISTPTAEQINFLAIHYPEKLMNAQLDYLIGNIDNRFLNPRATGLTNNAKVEITYAGFKRSVLAPSKLAVVFHDYYERSADSLSFIEQTRCKYATMWYGIFCNL